MELETRVMEVSDLKNIDPKCLSNQSIVREPLMIQELSSSYLLSESKNNADKSNASDSDSDTDSYHSDESGNGRENFPKPGTIVSVEDYLRSRSKT